MIEPSERSSDLTAQVDDLLDRYLAERGLSRNVVTDSDLRVDNVYLGPDRGACATPVMVRSAVLLQGLPS